jgi:ATP-dependent helicase IRC3
MTTALAPRPYQQEALDAIRTAYTDQQIRRPLVALPTGTGKTIIFALLLQQRRGRTLILAHRDELISQAVDKLRLVLGDVEVGIVKAERNDVAAPIVVASVQTLARTSRLEQLACDFQTIVVDEAHHAPAASYQRILHYLRAFTPSGPLTLGVTATVDRADRRGLDTTFQAIVFERSLLTMMKAGYLCDLRAVRVAVAANLDAVQRRHGDFADEALGAALLAANAPEQVVAAYQEHAAGRKAVCFTPTVAVAEAMAGAFTAAGISAASVDGTTPLEERRAILSLFESGDVRVLTNCQVFTEGWDCPSIDCVIVARPTSSRGFYTQMVGRGTRIHPGKDDCLILDVVGASQRHELVTVAGLVGLAAQDVAAEGVLGAVAAAEQRRIAASIPGALVARAVDLFARRRLHWVHAGARFVLTYGDGHYALEPEDAAWRIVQQTRAGSQVTHRGLSLAYAQGVAEDLVRQAGAQHLVDPQAALLARYGRPVPATKGEASDMLTVLFAQRVAS